MVKLRQLFVISWGACGRWIELETNAFDGDDADPQHYLMLAGLLAYDDDPIGCVSNQSFVRHRVSSRQVTLCDES